MNLFNGLLISLIHNILDNNNDLIFYNSKYKTIDFICDLINRSHV